MHILIGELDSWVPALACKELSDNAKQSGSILASLSIQTHTTHLIGKVQ